MLSAPKWSLDQLVAASSECGRLNAAQLHNLLSSYVPAAGEPLVQPDWVQLVASAAAQEAAQGTQGDATGENALLENELLDLPLLLPEDGYSSDAPQEGTLLPSPTSHFLPTSFRYPYFSLHTYLHIYIEGHQTSLPLFASTGLPLGLIEFVDAVCASHQPGGSPIARIWPNPLAPNARWNVYMAPYDVPLAFLH